MSYLDYSIFPEGITAFSTCRQDGFSQGAYASFNCTYGYGDDDACVSRNRQLLCKDKNIAPNRLFTPKQVHGLRIADINQDFLNADEPAQKKMLEGVDAMISPLADCCIAISTADCIPILLYDQRQQIIAAIHAGWRGTVKGIVTATLQKMQERYGCQSIDIHAAIGPGISLEAFEIGDEVYEQFQQAGFDMGRIARKYEKWHIDLWKANHILLTEWGIPKEKIETVNICTFNHNEKFFSARKAGINSGRILTGIMRKS